MKGAALPVFTKKLASSAFTFPYPGTSAKELSCLSNVFHHICNNVHFELTLPAPPIVIQVEVCAGITGVRFFLIINTFSLTF